MTLEEKLKVCSICKSRKHSIKEGLVCGKTEAKPAFADECPDFDIDVAEQERLKKNAAVSQALWLPVTVLSAV